MYIYVESLTGMSACAVTTILPVVCCLLGSCAGRRDDGRGRQSWWRPVISAPPSVVSGSQPFARRLYIYQQGPVPLGFYRSRLCEPRTSTFAGVPPLASTSQWSVLTHRGAGCVKWSWRPRPVGDTIDGEGSGPWTSLNRNRGYQVYEAPIEIQGIMLHRRTPSAIPAWRLYCWTKYSVGKPNGDNYRCGAVKPPGPAKTQDYSPAYGWFPAAVHPDVILIASADTFPTPEAAVRWLRAVGRVA